MKTFIIPTSQAEHVAKRIKNRAKGFEIIWSDLSRDRERYFPDGEVYVKIPNLNKLRDKRVIVLHSGAPKPNEGLIELELVLQILKDNDIKPEVFFTYFPYGMQDEVFEKGETNVAENLIEKLVNYYKVKKIYIIDPHFGGRKWVKKYPIISISAAPLLIERAKKDFGSPSQILRNKTWEGKNILFLSPDKGGQRRTKISGFRKERRGSFSVKIFSSKINFKGKIVGVIDDMIKSGGTLLKFYEIAKKSGARKIIALVTHGVIPAGISKIKKRYSKLYLTNTVKQKESNIDITNLILKNISKI
jgi:ribose-phosphate pyrophosphokinase